tara:strand:+ start:1794 stop:2162 length:369 start_codon:yes stop_codon:yes gene_type:complete
MTTKSLKPKPVRSHNKSTSQGQRMTKPGTIYSGKTVITKSKTMTEQTPLVNDTINKQTSHSLETITKVQSHLPDIQLISRDALLNDFKNRVKINNYEVRTAIKEFNQLVSQAKELYNSKVKR